MVAPSTMTSIHDHPIRMRESDGPIAHVVHSLEGGGTERGLIAMLNRMNLDRRGHAVVTLRGAGSLCTDLPDRVACRAFGARGRRRTLGCSLANYLRETGVKILHARNTGCWADAIVARLLTPSVRLVLGFHGLETDQPLTPRQRRWIAVARRLGAVFTSVSRAGQRQLSEQAGAPSADVFVLPNGIDPARFPTLDTRVRQRMRQSLQLADGAFVVGVVGSLTPVKRQVDLITALQHMISRNEDVHVLIVGDGPCRDQLLCEARQKGVEERARFVGWRDDVPDCLAAMDAYVCCSASEGMSHALLEAMATGLPIVTTDVGDHATIVRKGNAGTVVPPKSPIRLAERILELASDPLTARRFGRSARARAAEFTLDGMAQRYEHFYEYLLSGENGRFDSRSADTARGTPAERPPPRSRPAFP